MEESISNLPPHRNASVLLVIPCFRESQRLERFLPELCKQLEDSEIPVNILVVDDGSGETHAHGTYELVAKYRKQFSHLLEPLLLPKNLGKGGAVYAGWENGAQYEWVGFVDADGAIPPVEIRRVLGEVARHPPQADAWFGSRIMMLGRQVSRTLKRHIIGRIYATLASELLGMPVYDSQCGFKILRRSFFETIRPFLQDVQFGFDMELLVFLQKSGARIVEIPVDWQDIPGGQVRLLRDSWRMFFSLLALKARIQKITDF